MESPAGNSTGVDPRGWSLAEWVAKALLVIWIPGLLLVLGSLMTDHWAVLPKPEPGEQRLQQALAVATGDAGFGRWRIVHVLYTGCKCSQRVVKHLRGRETLDGAVELVLLVGESAPDLEAACRSRGFLVQQLTPEELEERYGVQAAPLFCIQDPTDRVVLVSGYTDRKQGLDYHDVRAYKQLRAGELAAPMPVYGCGVTVSLQELLDPFGLKY